MDTLSQSTTPTAIPVVPAWKPNTSSSSGSGRYSSSPCGRLVNNLECLNPHCDRSHDRWRIKAWKKEHAWALCTHGETCPHYPAGICLYYHPPEHIASAITRDTAIKSGLELLEPLDLNSLSIDQTVKLTDKGDLASFNKLADNEIIVPGCPPRFHPLTRPLTVQLDWHNTSLPVHTEFANYTHIFEPLLRSLEATDPHFDIFSAADVVTNASNLRKLFHVFSSVRKLTERFDLEWKHNTLFMSKWTGDPSLRSSLGRGAGFEKRTCLYADEEGDVETLRRSSSHHRVVWYQFAGMEFVVQSEVDGYYCDCHPPAQQKDGSVEEGQQRRTLSTPTLSSSFGTNYSPSPPSPTGSTPKHGRTTSSSHFSKFSSLLSMDDPGDTASFITSLRPKAPPQSPTLITHIAGRNVPSTCLIEVKTHKANNKPMFSPEAQLYFCRRTKLMVAQHRDGVFYPRKGAGGTAVQDKGEELRKWESEEQNQVFLGKVAALVRLLVGKMRERDRDESDELADGDLEEGGEDKDDVKGEKRGVSLVVESDGNGGVKAELYLRREAVSLLPRGV
ncbi:hypothetical protein B0H66DRAFT_483009 [Apodospora peruviana]|uniref:Uncharacterized protein n=1 Tax=Apodospora peruviana TaxID=516989 RepID=A0AAE0LZE1_9PEZI|nr:hypothetical protein B0H66DRAFT_483009 [Apodospora peruviana]